MFDDGSLGLIDLTTVSYGFPQTDLVEAEISICRRNDTAIAKFLDRYLESAEGFRSISREHYESTRPVFVALRHIIKASRRSRRITTRRVKIGLAWHNLWKEVLAHWEKAEQALRSAGAP